MLLIYSDAPGNRWPYIAKLLIGELGGYAYKITNNQKEFIAFNGCRLNYSRNRITEDEFHIIPAGLLWEENISVQNIEVFDCKDYPAFFKSPVESNWPFDIFAASFFLVSRYEEYLPFTPDEYGRYPHTGSVAYINGFLHRPLVNEWITGLKKKLLNWFPALWSTENFFRFIPTYDIDIAYSYLHKEWKLNLAGAMKSVSRLDFRALTDRIQVLAGNRKDPFDVYEWLYALHLKFRLKPVYFFLVAEKRKDYDRNILPSEKAMQELIQHHALGYNIGIHPSWQSGDEPGLINSEKKLLECITGMDVETSRQHYIRMKLPETYRLLLGAGIKNEYSMGYGSINGFRASISSTYQWYDLGSESVSALNIFPYCFMVANSFYEQNFTPAQA